MNPRTISLTCKPAHPCLTCANRISHKYVVNSIHFWLHCKHEACKMATFVFSDFECDRTDIFCDRIFHTLLVGIGQKLPHILGVWERTYPVISPVWKKTVSTCRPQVIIQIVYNLLRKTIQIYVFYFVTVYNDVSDIGEINRFDQLMIYHLTSHDE